MYVALIFKVGNFLFVKAATLFSLSVAPGWGYLRMVRACVAVMLRLIMRKAATMVAERE